MGSIAGFYFLAALGEPLPGADADRVAFFCRVSFTSHSSRLNSRSGKLPCRTRWLPWSICSVKPRTSKHSLHAGCASGSRLVSRSKCGRQRRLLTRLRVRGADALADRDRGVASPVEYVDVQTRGPYTNWRIDFRSAAKSRGSSMRAACASASRLRGERRSL